MHRSLPRIAALIACLTAPGLSGQQPASGGEAGAGAVRSMSAVLRVPAPDSADLAAAMRVLDDALAAAGAKDHARAAALYGQLGVHLPTLADWVPVFRAEALAELGDTAGVAEALSALPQESPIRSRWSWLPLARAYQVARAPERGLPHARHGVEVAVSDQDRALAWLRVGELSLAAKDTAAALEALVASMTAQRTGRHAADAADVAARLRGLDPMARYRIARVRAAQGRWKDAVDGLKAGAGLETLDRTERDQATLDLARAYFNTRSYASTERTAAPLVDDQAASDAVRARALYYTGRARYRQGDEKAGRATLESVAERFPAEDAAPDALWLLADMDHDAGRAEDAARYYAWIVDVSAASETATLAGMRLGGMRYLEGRYDDAARVFDVRRTGAGRADARQQAAYWAGLAYLSLDRPDSAAARFEEAYRTDPLTYYGAQSAARIGLPLLTAELAAGPSTPGADQLDDALANAVARLRVHSRVPTAGSFDYELTRLKDYFTAEVGGIYAFAEALIDGGLPIQGIVTGREIQRSADGWNLRLLRIVYPFPYREVIEREAALRDVNPYLAAGLIRQESMFDEDIRSQAGAIGMMQVMPATGQELARSAGIRSYSTPRLTEAEVNVQLGMRFLAQMLQRYDGEVLDALVAYNAGPTRIRRWRSMPEYRDLHVFTERIPFRETREYVKVVQQNALIYETLYGCGSGEPCVGMAPGAVKGLLRSTAHDDPQP